MRFSAAVGAVAGVVWLASAAAVPRLDDIFLSTCSGTSTEDAITGTLPPTSSPTTLVASSTCSSSAGETVLHTATITEFTVLSTSTAEIPAVTVTLPAEPGTPVAISNNSIILVSVATVTASAVPASTETVTVLETFGSDATTVVTLTYPDGLSHTSTVLVTLTIPDRPPNSVSWSTVITPPAIPTGLASQGVTVTLDSSSIVVAGLSSTCSLSSSVAASNPRPSTTATTVSSSSCSQTASADTGPSSLYRPYALTYTLSPESGQSTPFTGTITVTPSSPQHKSTRSTKSSSSVDSSEVDSDTATDTSEPLAIFPTPSSADASEPFASSSWRQSVTVASTAVSSSVNLQPNVVTATVSETLSPEAPETGNFSPSSSIALSGVSSAAPSDPSNLSSDGPTPYGPGAETQLSTVSLSLPLATSTVVTIGVSELSGYGSPGVGVSSQTDTEDTAVVTVTETVATTALSFADGPSLSATRGSLLTVTITEPAAMATVTPFSSVSFAPAPSGLQSAPIIFVTYTVPGQSGVGVSTYTVTYTRHTSGASSWGHGSVPSPSVGNPTPSQASTLSLIETGTPGNGSAASLHSTASVTFTVTPTVATNTGVSATTVFISDVEPVSSTPNDSGYGASTSSWPETSSTGLSTDLGGYQFGTSANLPVSASQPTPLLSITEVSSAVVSTVVVSIITLSQTVPLGQGSSTVLVFTTELTVIASPSLLTAPASTSVLTPVVPASTFSVNLPPLSSLTFSLVSSTSETEPVWPSLLSGSGGNRTSTGPTQSPEVLTIWPPASSLRSSTPAPVLTGQPVSTTSLIPLSTRTPCTATIDLEPTSAPANLVTSDQGSTVDSVGATMIQPSSPSLSEVTIWPLPASIIPSASCSTSGGSVAFSTTIAPLFSVTTVAPVPASVVANRSSSCAETGSSAGIGNIPPSSVSDSDVSLDLAPQPQSQFHHHGHAATGDAVDAASSTLGGYIFSTSSDSGYGNAASGYGNPAQTTPAALSTRPTVATATDSPYAQPTPASSSRPSYGTTSTVTSVAVPSVLSTSTVIASNTTVTSVALPSVLSTSTIIEPNTTVTSAAAPSVLSTSIVVESNTTVVTQSRTVSATSSAAPFPVATSAVSPNNQTSILISSSQTPVAATPLPPTTLGNISTVAPTNQPTPWLNSTTQASPSQQVTPLPIATSLVSPNNQTSTLNLSSSIPVAATALPPTTLGNLSTAGPTSEPTARLNSTTPASPSSQEASSSTPPLVSPSPVWVNSTTLVSSSSEVFVPPSTPVPNVGNTTVPLSATPLPTIASSTAWDSAAGPPLGFTSSGTVGPSVTGGASVVIMTLTITSTIGTVSYSQTIWPSSAAETSSLGDLSTSRPLLSSTLLGVTSDVIAATESTILLSSTRSSTRVTSRSSLLFPPTSGTASVPTTSLNSTSATIISSPALSATSEATLLPLTPTLPRACGGEGDSGEVVFEFDDIQTTSDGKDGEHGNIHPVPVPYHRFVFDGFDVVSPPQVKYQPSSGSQMLQSDTSSVAQIGLAQLRDNPCFRFDFEGVSLGCNSAHTPCLFEVSGLQWDGVKDVIQESTEFEVQACPEPSNCQLRHLHIFGPAYTNLTAVNITLGQPSETKTWWIDDLRIAWTDDDCAAAICRSRVPNTAMTPHPRGSVAGKAKRLLRWAVRG